MITSKKKASPVVVVTVKVKLQTSPVAVTVTVLVTVAVTVSRVSRVSPVSPVIHWMIGYKILSVIKPESLKIKRMQTVLVWTNQRSNKNFQT